MYGNKVKDWIIGAAKLLVLRRKFNDYLIFESTLEFI